MKVTARLSFSLSKNLTLFWKSSIKLRISSVPIPAISMELKMGVSGLLSIGEEDSRFLFIYLFFIYIAEVQETDYMIVEHWRGTQNSKRKVSGGKMQVHYTEQELLNRQFERYTSMI